MYGYVVPLYQYGWYFGYFVDGAQYSATPIETDWTVAVGLTAFQSNYIGTVRFETSLGLLASGSSPFVSEVGPGEDKVTVRDSVIE